MFCCVLATSCHICYEYCGGKMSNSWERCPNGETTTRWARHYVSMNPKGYIVMNRKAHDALKNPEMVHLFFDTANNQIGVRAADARSHDVFRVAKQGRHGGCLIRAYRLLQEFNIDVPETVRFHGAAIDKDGILVLDLNTATKRNSSRLKV